MSSMNVLAVIITLVFGFNAAFGFNYKSSDGCPNNDETINVFENTNIGTIIYNISGVDNEPTLDFSDQTKSTYFRIDENNGDYLLKINKSLDYETDPHRFHFGLTCGADFFRIQITVAVKNVFEGYPTFRNRSYTYSVPENTTVGSRLFEFPYNDPENLGATQIQIDISSEPSKSYFKIDASVPFLKLAKKLNYSEKTEFTFDFVMEVPDYKYNDTVPVTIKVLDSDNRPPAFTKNTYTVKIPENAAMKSVWNIASVIPAFDLDTGINQEINFRIMAEFPEKSFDISLTNASLIVTGSLDRERTDTYHLLIKAFQTDKPITRTASATVEVQIQDVNDNNPTMLQTFYNLSIIENTPANTEVLSLSAVDKDSFPNNRFKYVLNDTSGGFKIDENTGVISVQNSPVLDRENRTSFNLQAYAIETQTAVRKKSNNTFIHIYLLDENDNSPKFEKQFYRVDINKTAKINSTILKTTASDPDYGVNKIIEYMISGDDLQTEKFIVDKQTGNIKIKKSLSEEFNLEYNFFVVASDKATQPRRSSVPVRINVFDVNIHKPKFDVVPPVSVKEDLQKGSHIITVQAHDQDFNDSLEYRIETGDNQQQFEINTTSGEITLKQSLDREIKSTYNLMILVTDGNFNDTTTVNITVLDVNDNPPRFKHNSYSCNVTEGTTNTIVFKPDEASDGDIGNNSKIVYSISSVWNKNFTINNSTGEIKTIGALDRENPLFLELKSIKITVTAQDFGSPSLSSQVDVLVYINDINDNAPHFNDPNVTVTILESATGLIFSSRAFDSDEGENGLVLYKMKSGNTSLFKVTTTGSLMLINGLDIDNGSNMKYEVKIEANNSKPYASGSQLTNGVQTITVVIKDINDQTPQFNESVYSFTMNESVIVGTKINETSIRFSAIDKDRTKQFNTVAYSLSDDDDSANFIIDKYSGELYTVTPFDYETKTELKFRVFATDGKPTAGGNSIEKVSANVTLNITDVNDNSPKFTREEFKCIFEEGSLLSRCRVNATDADSGNNRKIMYRIKQKVNDPLTGDTEFLLCTSNCSIKIDKTTGILKPREAIYRNKGDHVIELKVEAIDSGIPTRTGTAVINVFIKDINNNAPIFNDQEIIYVFKELEMPQDFYIAKAYDNDTGKNGKVIYSLDSKNGDLFDIFENGTLKTKKPLQIRNKGDENVTVIITAYNSVPYTDSSMKNGTQTLTILIQDVNNHSPIFQLPQYSFTTPENIKVGDILYGSESILARDADISLEYGSVTYWLSGAGSEDFKIDSKSAILTIARQLDFETMHSYNFNVYASDMHSFYDGTPSKNVSANIKISVTDVNDNSPRFSSDTYMCVLSENKIGPVTGCVINATDLDSGLNGRLTYRISKNVTSSKGSSIVNSCSNDCGFIINTSTGMISSNRTFNRAKDSYDQILLIEALDGGTPQRSGSAFVIVNIHDINDNPPVFDDSNITLVLPELTPPREIHIAVAHDTDTDSNAKIMYRLKSGNSSLFSVTANGRVNTKQQLHVTGKESLTHVIQIEAYNTVPYDPPTSENATQTVTVIVEDVNNHSPNFTLPQYSFATPENIKVGDILNGSNSILARDADISLEYGSVTYWLSGAGSEHFKIDSKSAILTIARQLDFETMHFYNFQVYASDMHSFYDGTPSKNVSANIKISVTDVNDNSPRFSSDTYMCVLSENKIGPVTGCVINATDLDSGLNGRLTYRISKNVTSSKGSSIVNSCSNDCGFIINTSTGMISSNRTFNRAKDSYDQILLIEALDGGTPQRSGSAFVIVNIHDINDNPPVFDDSNITLVLPELTPPREIHIAVAHDTDIDINAKIMYRLKSGNSSLFSVTTNGRVNTKQQLHVTGKESMTHVIQIEAYNTVPYDPPTLENATQTVTVIVEDVNDHYPEFDKSSYTFSVLENATVGQILGLDKNITITAVDKDLKPEFNTVRYWLAGTGNDYFTIEKYTGIIRVAKPLDFENRTEFILRVFASDMHVYMPNNTVISVSASVNIHIKDVNDNKPKFTKDIYYCTINEDTIGSVSKCDIKAYDGDKETKITYQLMNVQETQDIDTEEIEVCSQPSMCGFTINTTTGALKSRKKFTRDKSPNIKMLMLRAIDNGVPALSSSALVFVYIEDINNHRPIFDDKIVTYVFDELTTPTEFHTAVAHDADSGLNGKVFYKLKPVKDHALFSINMNGTLSVKERLIMHKLDSRKRTVEIEAYNNNSSTTTQSDTQLVNIYIKDVNNNDPLFEKSKYSFTVAENATGQTINKNQRIIAIDNDTSLEFNTIHYWLEGDGHDHFMITDNGEIIVSKLLDYERNTTFTLNVFASDMHPYTGTTSIHNSSVVINIKVSDVNDNAPHFTNDSYECSVKEHTTKIENCEVLATDKDASTSNNQIVYSMVQSRHQLPFNVTSGTGHITVTGGVDYDRGDKSYSFVVYATDNGSPTLTGSTVVVITVLNENDNPPRINQTKYKFKINENEQINTIVGIVQATDKDGDTIYFALNNQTEDFSIDNSGVIFTKKIFDYEAIQQDPMYYISLNVTDGDHVVSTIVEVEILNVNDNDPVFENDTYSVELSENATTGSLIQVTAYDVDNIGALNYSLVSTGNCDIFSISSDSGLVMYNNNIGCLDYETQRSISLLVEVNDGGNIGRAVIEVGITDSNDMPPYFLFDHFIGTVKENEKLDTAIMTVFAEDKDSSTEDLIYDVIDNRGYFKFSGNVLVTSAKLNREEQQHYTINISVSDGPHTTFSVVYVTVIDINDNAPQITPFRQNVTIVQDVAQGTVIQHINVTDPDLSGGFTFYIMGDKGDFKIDEKTGVITVDRTKHFTVNATYNMSIHVVDYGSPPLTNTTWIYVYIDTSNRHSPVFTNASYAALVAENAELGTSVLNISANDADLGKNGEIDYRIVSGSEGKFEINITSGEITLIGHLNFESKRNIPYRVVVEAHDNGDNPKSATTTVAITVDDINEPPAFPQKKYDLCMNLPVAKGQPVSVIQAIDDDSSKNGYNVLTYNIDSGNTMNIFTIDNKGLISASKSVNDTFKGTTLIITATDGGGLNDTATVSIAVIERSGDGTQPSVIMVNTRENQTGIYTITNINTTDESFVRYSIVNSSLPGWFTIQNSTGVITASKPLDREVVKTVTIEFEVDRKSRRSNDSTCHSQVVINVIDINDNQPYFISTTLHVSVNETGSKSSADDCIAELKAYDPDITSKLEFNITKDNSNGKFDLIKSKNESVCISIQDTLDYESIPKAMHDVYQIEVMVSDGKYNDTASVSIKVLDVNDNYPYFDQAEFKFSILEDTPILSLIHEIQGFDKDKLDIGRLEFNISDDVDASTFAINQDKNNDIAKLILKGTIDRERQSSYIFTIYVIDTSGHQNSSLVNITIEDVNDNSPVFDNSTYELTVPEGKASLHLSYYITATDADLGNNATVSFRIKNSPLRDSFAINKTDFSDRALFTVTKELHRDHAENIQNGNAIYVVVVEAYDHGTPTPRSSTAQIIVRVTDINNCAPSFEKSHYSASVIEGSPSGFSVFSVEAHDCDYYPEYKNISYILGGPDKDVFIIDHGGNILLNETIGIKKSSDSYNITVTASDGTNSNQTSISIHVTDVNDHDPTFDRNIYNFTTPENDFPNAAHNVFVGNVTATDEDYGKNGEISYEIISSDVQDLFNISESGVITAIGILDHDTCATNVINFIVAAIDHGLQQRTGYVEVIIYVSDVNDNSPEFTSSIFSGTIAENPPYDTQVIVNPVIQVQDKDDGENGVAGILFTLEGDGSGTTFKINENTGMIKVNNGSLIDRETKSHYNLTVIARDQNGKGKSAEATLEILVIDKNDESPIFIQHKYTFNVSEDANSSFIIGSVQATDQDLNGNKSIRYSIVDGSDGRFYIDKLTGILYIGGLLDRERRDTHVLNISASDGKHEDYAEVLIYVGDINDNCPKFTMEDLIFSINEDRNFNHSLKLIKLNATDRDAGENGHVTFFINNTGSLNISITPDGTITRNEKFDRETKSRYEFIVYAKDNGMQPCTSKAKVTLNVEDINDNSPKFYNLENNVINSINASVIEKTPVGSPIIFPDARDKDIGLNGQIKFNLTAADDELTTYFKINVKTGVIIVSKVINILEFEHKNLSHDSVLYFTLTATDEGLPPLSTSIPLHILIEKINDESPVFVQNPYDFAVLENIKNGSVIGKVEASENVTFSTLVYSILPQSSAAGYFIVHPLSGQITTYNNLDRESNDHFTFPVQVVDGRTPERTAFAMVTVTIMDENDNTPSFEKDHYYLRVLENTVNVSLMFIKANDPDKGDNGTITYSLIFNDGCDYCLLIDENSGELHLNGSFDREKSNETHILIQASDHGTPPNNSTVDVTVLVLDINDNAPEFEMLYYETNVSENKPPGQVLLTVRATDPDKGLNGTVTYHLYPDTDVFDINAIDGTIMTLKSLDYESQSVYTITVVATDLGSPPLHSTTNVTINVIDEFDEVIQFNKNVYMANYKTEQPVDSAIIQISTGVKGALYSIMDGNENDYFNINSSTGMIESNKVFYKANTFLLSAKAQFIGHPNVSTTSKVLIIVHGSQTGIQNNTYSVSLMENLNTTHGILVFDVNTTQERLGEFVSYRLVESIPSGNFRIDSYTGKIFCLESLDRETHSQYILHIMADTINSTRNKRSFGDSPGEIVVVLNVENENDNYPVFITGNPIYIKSDIKKGDLITTLSAVDLDDGNGDSIRFSVADKDNSTFSIDTVTGDLYSKINLVYTTNYSITVLATDTNGTGLQSSATFQITLLPSSSRLIFALPIPLSEYKIKEKTLLQNLSNILGINISVEKTEAHLSGNLVHPTPQTYLYFYGINRTTKAVLPSEFVKRIIEEKMSKINNLFNNSTIEEVSVVPMRHDYKFSEAEIALLTIAVIILILSVFAVIITQIIWKRDDVAKYEKTKHDQLKLFELESMKSPSLRSLNGSAAGVVNPVFLETKFDENRNTPQVNEETLHKRGVVYESQEITVEFGDDSVSYQRRASQPQHDDAAANVSVGDSGTSTISGENDSNTGSLGERREENISADVIEQAYSSAAASISETQSHQRLKVFDKNNPSNSETIGSLYGVNIAESVQKYNESFAFDVDSNILTISMDTGDTNDDMAETVNGDNRASGKADDTESSNKAGSLLDDVVSNKADTSGQTDETENHSEISNGTIDTLTIENDFVPEESEMTSF